MSTSVSRGPVHPPPDLDPPAPEAIALQYQVERFLHYEAEILDQRHFQAWLDLLTEDVRYWMPLARNFAFGQWEWEHTGEDRDLNWFDEGKFELEQRVRQIETGKHWCEEPLSRTTHVIGNVQARTLGNGEIEARSNFVVYRNRTEVEWDLFVGKRVDTLRRGEHHLRIARREIYLDQNVLLAKNLTIFF